VPADTPSPITRPQQQADDTHEQVCQPKRSDQQTIPNGAGKGKVAKAKGKAKPKPKAKGKAKAATSRTVIVKATSAVQEYAATMQRARFLETEIMSNTALEWAKDDRFKGKLSRQVQKCDNKLAEHTDLYNLAIFNAALSQEFINDVHGSMSAIEEVLDEIHKVEATRQRIQAIDHEDQPSQ
jgi:hypothetical protein